MDQESNLVQDGERHGALRGSKDVIVSRVLPRCVRESASKTVEDCSKRSERDFGDLFGFGETQRGNEEQEEGGSSGGGG
jgi:hypothetical protein